MRNGTSLARASRVLLASASILPALVWAGGAEASALCIDTTPIYEIQGTSHVSPYEGQTVETCGVVTAVGFQSYYIQDPYGDDDSTTSDGLFVFDTRTPQPEVGELLRLRDRVDERIAGGADTGNLSTTQFAFPTILGREAARVPAPVVIGRGGRMPPARKVISNAEIDPPINLQDAADAAANRFNPWRDGIDFYESLEGMLVTVENPVAVSGSRQFGTFSAEVFTLANRGRFVRPTDARTARGGISLQRHPDNRGDQNPERIQIQFDGTLYGSTDFPAIKVGDRFADVTGVVGYSFGNYEVNALGAFDIRPKRLRPQKAQLSWPKRLTVASYNVLNLSAVEDDDAQRDKVATQIVRKLRAPDIVALQEIQDNNGDIGNCGEDLAPCSGELDADETLQGLVDAIVAAGGPAYAFIDVPPLVETTDDNRDNPDTFGGISLGNIRNAFLYNPERVTLEAFEGLTRDVLTARGVSVPTAFDTSRDPLEATFRFRGRPVTVINNHFSSRFGSTPVFGGPQPFIQAAEAAREAQSTAINEVVDAILEDTPRANVVVLGDLNTFEWTNDLKDLLPGSGPDRVLINLIRKIRDDNRYTFIFEGNSQALDHIFVSQNMVKGARLDIVHVNTDFSRMLDDVTASDHEPLLATIWPRR